MATKSRVECIGIVQSNDMNKAFAKVKEEKNLRHRKWILKGLTVDRTTGSEKSGC